MSVINRTEILKQSALFLFCSVICLLSIEFASGEQSDAQTQRKSAGVALAPVQPALTLTARPPIHTPTGPKRTAKAGATSKIFNGGEHSLIHTTTSIISNAGKIAVSIELGMPYAINDASVITNAPAGMKFSRLTWSNLDLAHLPRGTTVTSSHLPGQPEIPMLSIRLAIPEGSSNVKLSLANDRVLDITGAHLIPSLNWNDQTRGYSASYAGAHSIQSQLEEAITFRTLHYVTIDIPLAEVLANGTVRAKRSVNAVLSFTTAGGDFAATKRNADPLFEEVGQRMVANQSDVNRFQSGFHRVHNVAGKSNRQTLGSDSLRTFDLNVTSWIDRNAPYAKISISRTGLYRVTALDIGAHTNSSQLDLLNWTPNEIRLFNHGHEIPVWIDSTANGHVQAIEFYGERQPGFPGEYYNVATDTNAYWLTNSRKSSSPPLRYKDRAPSGNAQADLSTGNTTLHHERDKFYYPGDTEPNGDDSKTVQRTEWIPGRRFVWTELDRPNGVDTARLFDTFTIALPQDTAGKRASFSAFLRGISGNPSFSSPNHRYRILINGQPIADSAFSNYDSIFVQRSIPFGILKQGSNAFQLLSVGTSNDLDRFHFDFYSIALAQPLVPSADTSLAYGQLLFTNQLPQGITSLTVASTDNVRLFNLTDTTRIVARSPNGGATLFRDSSNGGPKLYAGSTSTGLLKADQIYGWNVGVAGQGWDILDTTKGSDFIVITHPIFKSVGAKIEFFRKNQLGIRTKLVTTDEVFNAFNFGSNEPWAIRQFLHYAYDFYQGTPPGFVTLVGDGAWDPKHNLNTSTHFNFVPSFGNPVSDFVFTTLEGTGKDSLVPEMVIARIPVDDTNEAASYYSKLQRYATDAPAAWNKRFLYVVGGDGPGDQHSLLVDEIHAYNTLKPYGGLQLPPLAISPSVIERTDFKEVDFTHEAEIQERLREGASLMYFAGHGAPNITDVSFGNPNLLRNSGPYTVLISLSCRTGAFAENDITSISEDFLRAKDQGAIATFGTSGFGEIGYDFDLSVLMWNLMDAADSDRANYSGNRLNLATIFTLAKVQTSLGTPSGGLVFGNQNSLNQYLVLGDALTGFALRPKPELAVFQSDLSFSNSVGVTKPTFTLSDSSFTIHANVHDFGYAAQGPVHVRIRDLGPQSSIPVDVVIALPKLDSTATVSATFPIDTMSIGQHTISVFVDYDSLYTEEHEDDNIATLGLIVNGSSVTVLYPPEGSRSFCDVSVDSIHFVMLPPAIGAQSSINGTIEIEMDTTSAFTKGQNVATITVVGSPVEIGVAKAKIPTSFSKVVWIRIRFTPPSQAKGPWVVLSESIDQSTAPAFSYSTPDQLRPTIQDHLVLNAAGALTLPLSDTTFIEVVSHGGNDTNNAQGATVSHLKVGSLTNSISNPSLVIAYFSADGSAIENLSEIHAPTDGNDLEDVSVAKIFDSLFKLIPDGRRVAVFTNLQPYYNSPNTPFYKNATVHADLLALGGHSGVDSTSYFGSYALLGRKGAKPGSSQEATGPRGGGGVTLRDSTVNFHNVGNAHTPFTAVASRYGKLSWIGKSVTNHSDILFTVVGHNRTTSVEDTLKTFRASAGNGFDLSQIDSRSDNELSIAMHFLRDSNATQSPELSGISIEYSAAPELTIEPNSFKALPSSANEGVPVASSYTIRNLTCVPVSNLTTELEQTYHNTTTITNTHAQISLAGHASVTILDTLQTFGLNGRVDLLAYANPNELINEQYLLNDQAQTSFKVGRDTTKPLLDVSFDGRHVYNCDYVSNRPKIEIALSDNSPIRLTDSTSISALLRSNGDPANPIYLSNTQSNSTFDLQFVRLPSGKVQAELIAKPNATGGLKPDTWTLTAYAKDASGNAADTISICFVVAASNGLDHVMNVPNPFKDQTSMTYQLRSGGNADVKIVIYTIAGRKIRTLTPDPGTPPHAGINYMIWDGRDETGNEIANGTYLYRVVMNGANQDGSSATDAITERAVKSR